MRVDIRKILEDSPLIPTKRALLKLHRNYDEEEGVARQPYHKCNILKNESVINVVIYLNIFLSNYFNNI